MCGITWVYHYGNPDHPVDSSALQRMTHAVAHRGPDGSGFHIDGPVGLGHRRLAIVDLSPTGAQPMSTGDNRYTIVYNGETYNHLDLRRSMPDSKNRFRGSSDTETILHLLQTEGPQGLSKLIGIFGLALWDKQRRSLLLARDPLGVKQVYYYDDGKSIVFASEIKALFHWPNVPRQLDPEGLNQYIHFYTPLFERTFFNGIKQLRPGEFMLVEPTGVKTGIYWKLDEFGTLNATPEEAIAHLRQSLSQVVNDQLMADVPVGAFFSGGIDSSAVASFAARQGKRPMLFGVHFSNQGVIDERPYQEEAARALGLELHLTTVDESQFPYDLPKLLYFQDCPVIGPALLPMFQVSRLARQNVKVCLGGQGADEIFAGYARYGITQPWKTMGSILLAKLGRRRQQDGGAVAGSEASVRGNLWKQLADARNVRRLCRTAWHLFDWQTRYFETFALIPETIWGSLLTDPTMVSRQRCFETFRETVAKSPARDPATKVMHWDMQTWLPGLFHQDDRMSMANSLESRVPLADPRLVHFAFQCDFGLKFRSGASKWLLRQAVADVLPENVLNRRKVGFDTPTKRWMQHTHRDFVRDTLCSRAARERGWWNHARIGEFIDNHNHPLWHDVMWRVLCVEIWAQTFLDHGSQWSTQTTSPGIPAAVPVAA